MTDLPAADQPDAPLAQHTFVQLTMIPVEATLKPDGVIDLHVTEAAEEISIEEAKVGCWFCGVPLDADSIYTPCVGLG